jgi:hypothetical protein
MNPGVAFPPMSERSRLAKPAAGALGTLGIIISVWWFALRPRRKRRRAGNAAGSSA